MDKYLGLYRFEGMPLRVDKIVLKEPKNLLVGIQRGKERKYFPVANFLLLMFPAEWANCAAKIFSDVMKDYTKYLTWREKQMDVKDFAEREPKVTLLESLLKLFAKNLNLRLVQVVFGDMRFRGNSYILQEDFVVIYTGNRVNKSLGITFVGRVPIREISEVGLAGDVLTITI